MTIEFPDSANRPGREIPGSAAQDDELTHPRLWQGLAWCMVWVVVWLSLTPHPPEPPAFLAWDKAQHCLAYAFLMFWFRQAFSKTWRWPLFLVALGVGIEFLQGYGGFRVFDRLDMLANSIGVVLGFMLANTSLGGLVVSVDALIFRRAA